MDIPSTATPCGYSYCVVRWVWMSILLYESNKMLMRLFLVQDVYMECANFDDFFCIRYLYVEPSVYVIAVCKQKKNYGGVICRFYHLIYGCRNFAIFHEYTFDTQES